MSDPVCRCGHPRLRHFSGSMVKGHHACLAIDGKIPCECRRFDHDPSAVAVAPLFAHVAVETRGLSPARIAKRNKDLL